MSDNSLTISHMWKVSKRL